jgi:hypothetical protein
MQATLEFLLIEKCDRKETYAAVGTAQAARQVVE